MTKTKGEDVRWVSAFETGLDYEADLVRDRLDNNDVPAVVFTQRDHSFNLTIGGMSPIHVMVPMDRLEDALICLGEAPFTQEELEEAARAADPEAPGKHSEEVDSLLDSSIERLRFIARDDAEDEADKA